MAPSNSHFSFVILPSLIGIGSSTDLSNSSAVGHSVHLIDKTVLECPVPLQIQECWV